MNDKFSELYDLADEFGRIVEAHMYEDGFVNIEIVDEKGHKYTLSMRKAKEEENND